MKQYIDWRRVANEVMMLRRMHRGSFMIVEGPTDARVFRNLVDNRNCKLVIAYSKNNAIKALHELEERGQKGILAIVDADYWALDGVLVEDPNLFLTDTHDLETMILLSPALEKVISEYLPGDKVGLLERIGEEIREELVRIGLSIGYLRWINDREDLYLCFDSLPISTCLDSGTLDLDMDQIIKASTIGSRNHTMSAKSIRHKLDELSTQNGDPWHICQGHDLVLILEVVLPVMLDRIVGRRNADRTRTRARAEILDKELRLAYEHSFFIRTRLYVSIRDWETRCTPYRVLVQ